MSFSSTCNIFKASIIVLNKILMLALIYILFILICFFIRLCLFKRSLYLPTVQKNKNLKQLLENFELYHFKEILLSLAYSLASEKVGQSCCFLSSSHQIWFLVVSGCSRSFPSADDLTCWRVFFPKTFFSEKILSNFVHHKHNYKNADNNVQLRSILFSLVKLRVSAVLPF